VKINLKVRIGPKNIVFGIGLRILDVRSAE
jgi:hypothetical protein